MNVSDPTTRRLPDLSLPSLSDGASVPLRARRRASVLVILDSPVRDLDLAYLRELGNAHQALLDWDGRVMVILSDEDEEDEAVHRSLTNLQLPFPILRDGKGRVATSAGVSPPALIITDQWGEARGRVEAGQDRSWLAVAEVEEWLKFLATQCSECGD